MSPLEFEPTARWRRAHTAAEIIETARQMVVPKLPQRIAAQRAGITSTYWPVIVRGWRFIGGVQAPVTPPDDTLLRMARAVGVEQQVRDALADDADDAQPTPDLSRLPTEELIRWGLEIARRYPRDEAIQQSARLLAMLAEQSDEGSEMTG